MKLTKLTIQHQDKRKIENLESFEKELQELSHEQMANIRGGKGTLVHVCINLPGGGQACNWIIK